MRSRPGERFAELGPDGHDLEHRPHQEAQEDRVGEEAADREVAGQDLAGAHVHDRRADEPEEHGRGEAQQRGRAEGLEDVREHAPHPLREHARLAGLGVVPLHHTHAPERLGEAAGDLGLDLAPLAEDRPQRAHGPEQHEAEDRERAQGDEGHRRAQAHHDREGEEGGHDPAQELDEAGADQVPHPLHVAHDAGHELPRLVGVVVGDGQPADMGLHPQPHLGDQPLRCLREQLGERKRSQTLEDRGPHHRRDQGQQQIRPPMPDDVVDQELRRSGEHQARGPVHGHERQSPEQHPPARTNEGPEVGEEGSEPFRARGRRVGHSLHSNRPGPTGLPRRTDPRLYRFAHHQNAPTFPCFGGSRR